MRITAVRIIQEAAITIIVTPQVSLITISHQVEAVMEDRTVYQVKALEEEVTTAVEEAMAEEVIMEEVVAKVGEEMKVEVAEAAATNFLLIRMFARTD